MGSHVAAWVEMAASFHHMIVAGPSEEDRKRSIITYTWCSSFLMPHLLYHSKCTKCRLRDLSSKGGPQAGVHCSAVSLISWGWGQSGETHLYLFSLLIFYFYFHSQISLKILLHGWWKHTTNRPQYKRKISLPRQREANGFLLLLVAGVPQRSCLNWLTVIIDMTWWSR